MNLPVEVPLGSQRHEVARHGAGLGSGVPSFVAWAFGHCHGRRRWSKFGQLEAAGVLPALGFDRGHDRSLRAAASAAEACGTSGVAGGGTFGVAAAARSS